MENNEKPSWKTAPSWANYLAQDEDGRWFWFAEKPEVCAGKWIADNGRYSPASSNSWEDTLEERGRYQ